MSSESGSYMLEVEPLASADHETIAAWRGPTLQRYLTGERDVGDERSAGLPGADLGPAAPSAGR